MTHLQDAEFVDLIDGLLAPERIRHADQCDVCRARAEALRATLADAAGDGAWEPSPLFWEHFTARVSQAIREEAPAGRSRWFGARSAVSGFWSSPARALAAATVVSLLMVLAVAWRATLHAPPSQAVTVVTEPAPAPPGEALATVANGSNDLDTDEAWAVVRTAADGLGWEDAHAAGLNARPGSAERIALELSADERVELARLIQDELKRSGA